MLSRREGIKLTSKPGQPFPPSPYTNTTLNTSQAQRHYGGISPIFYFLDLFGDLGFFVGVSWFFLFVLFFHQSNLTSQTYGCVYFLNVAILSQIHFSVLLGCTKQNPLMLCEFLFRQLLCHFWSSLHSFRSLDHRSRVCFLVMYFQ